LFNISDNPYFIAASIIVSLASNVISFIPPPSSGLAPIITLWQNPLNWMEFFAMGILFNRLGLLEKVINGKFRIKFILVVITVLIAGLLVWVPLKINYWNPLAIVLEFVSIVSIPIITFKFIDSKSLSSLGRNSYLLYLLHMQLGIALANILFSIVSVPDFIILLTKPLIVLGITMCLIFLIKLTVRLLKLDRFNQYIGLYSNGTK
jgi:membrane protein